LKGERTGGVTQEKGKSRKNHPISNVYQKLLPERMNDYRKKARREKRSKKKDDSAEPDLVIALTIAFTT